MHRWAVPVVILSLIVVGLFLAGWFDGNGENGSPGPRETDGPAVVTPTPDFGENPSAPAGTGATNEPDPAEARAPESTSELPAGTAALFGRVVDEDRQPVEGAIVHLLVEEEANPSVGPPALDQPLDRRESDPDGRFRYDGIAARPTYTLFVRSEGSVGVRRTDLSPRDTEIEIVLRAGDLVTGVVHSPEGRPVAGAIVTAGPTLARLGEGIFLPAGGPTGGGRLLPETISATDGSFVLSGIPGPRFGLTARHPNYGPSAVVNLMQGQDDLILALRANTAIEGRVVDFDGRPVAGAIVRTRAQFFLGPDPSTHRDEVETGADGTFRLEGLGDGSHRVTARAEGYSRSESSSHSIEPGETVRGVELVLRPAAVVRGHLVNEAGTPIEDARVFLRAPESDGRLGNLTAVSATDGTFEVEGIEPGSDTPYRTLLAEVEHDEYSYHVTDPFEVETGGDIELGTITLFESTRITGRVADLHGRPVPGAMVELISADGAPTQDVFMGSPNGDLLRHIVHGSVRTKTDETGSYRLEIEEWGSWRVAAEADGFQRAETEAYEVGERGLENVDLTLEPALSIEGIVVDELGEPCADVRVYATAPEVSSRMAPTTIDGTFTFEGLGDRGYSLGLSHEGWSLAEDSPAIEAGTTGVVLVATRPGLITGRIIDSVSGAPVPRFTLRTEVYVGDGVSRIHDFFFASPVEYSHPDGRFRTSQLPPGKHEVIVTAPGRVETTEIVEVASGRTTEVTIAIAPAGSVTGRLVDASGNPIMGVQVAVERLDGEESGSSVPMQVGVSLMVNTGEDGGTVLSMVHSTGSSATTDEDGRFNIEGLAGGEWKLTFSHSDFEETSEEPVTVRRGEETDAGTITLLRGARLHGRIVRADGASLLWASLTATPIDAGESKSANIDDDGNYSLGGLDAGEYRISVHSMVQPEDANEFGGASSNHHEPGTVRLEADENRTFDIVLPAE